MHLTVLAVARCPNAPVLQERLAAVIDGRAGVSVSHEVISSEYEAARWGMHGSPTLLIDGMDPFAKPGQPTSMSCRLYRDDDGQATAGPSADQLRQAIEQASAAATVPEDPAWLDALGRGGRISGDCPGPPASICCGYINFFATQAAATAWAASHPEITGGILGQDRALHVGIGIFGRLLS